MSGMQRQLDHLLSRIRDLETQLAASRAASGEKASWIRGRNPASVISVLFELTSGLTDTVGATATADIVVTSDTTYPVASSIEVYNTGKFKAPTGAIGCAVLITVGASSEWWVVHVQENVGLLEFTFTGPTHVYTAPADYRTLTAFSVPQTITYSGLTGVSDFPLSFLPASPTITNPGNHYATSGDTGYAIWDTDADAFVLHAVKHQYCRKILFKLNTNWPLGLDQTQTDAVALAPFPGETGPVPTSFTLRDRYNRAHNARAYEAAARPADVGVAVCNYSTLEYDIIECSHRATHIFGYLDDDFASTPATFDVDSTSGYLDGSDPTGGTNLVTVQNAYSWEAGTVGHYIEIFRNPLTGQWIPRQMRCPT